jgi:hypothetical protein
LHHAWFVERGASGMALDTTPDRDRETSYCGVPLEWSYVDRRTTVFVLKDGVYASVIEGAAPWPKNGPPIYAGSDVPESFLARLKRAQPGKEGLECR